MAKNNAKTWRIIGIGVIVCFAAAGIIYAYGVLNTDVEHNKAAIEENEEELEKHEEKIDKHEIAVVEIRKDVGSIQKDMTRQTAILEEIQKEIKK